MVDSKAGQGGEGAAATEAGACPAGGGKACEAGEVPVGEAGEVPVGEAGEVPVGEAGEGGECSVGREKDDDAAGG